MVSSAHGAVAARSVNWSTCFFSARSPQGGDATSEPGTAEASIIGFLASSVPTAEAPSSAVAVFSSLADPTAGADLYQVRAQTEDAVDRHDQGQKGEVLGRSFAPREGLSIFGCENMRTKPRAVVRRSDGASAPDAIVYALSPPPVRDASWTGYSQV